VGSRIVVRLTYRRFCLGFEVDTRVWVQSPGETILEGFGGGGQFGTGRNWWIHWEIGVDGGDGRHWTGGGRWLIGGYEVVPQSRCGINNL
jgi:hypothetical protein